MPETIAVPSQQLLERILTLEIVRVTERAAVSAARLRGYGNKIAADQAAVDAMRRELNKMAISGTIVIGDPTPEGQAREPRRSPVGGSKGGPARAAALTAEQRAEIARVAAQTR